jgi:hypothetical protein
MLIMVLKCCTITFERHLKFYQISVIKIKCRGVIAMAT